MRAVYEPKNLSHLSDFFCVLFHNYTLTIMCGKSGDKIAKQNTKTTSGLNFWAHIPLSFGLNPNVSMAALVTFNC